MDQRQGDDWKEERYNHVTGTDVAKIMGVDKETSAMKLVDAKVRKIDLMADATLVTKSFLLLGNVFEESAKQSFLRDMGNHVRASSSDGVLTRDLIYPWLAGTPDYIVKAPGHSMVVEFKTHFWPMPTEATPYESTERVPLKHWLQVQCYLHIMDVKIGLLYSWTMSHSRTMFLIARDDTTWAAFIFPKLMKFRNAMVEARGHEIGSPEYLKIIASLRWKSGEKAEAEDLLRAAMLFSTRQVTPEHFRD